MDSVDRLDRLLVVVYLWGFVGHGSEEGSIHGLGEGETEEEAARAMLPALRQLVRRPASSMAGSRPETSVRCYT